MISNYDKNLNYDIETKDQTIRTIFSPSLPLFSQYTSNVVRSVAGSWFLIHLLSLVLQYCISVSFNSAVELLVSPFLVLHFSYYTLMTFLIMFSVILLCMLMILISTLNVVRYLICGNN